MHFQSSQDLKAFEWNTDRK